MKKIFTVAATLSLIAALAAGCNNQPDYSSKNYSFYSMNTQADLIISDKFTSELSKKFDDLCSAINAELYKIDNSISVNVGNSSISKFNGAQAGEAVVIDQTAYTVLSEAKRIYELTDGYYNPAVYYNVQAYGFNESSSPDKPNEQRIPSDELIEKYQQLSSHFGETEIYQGEDNRFYAKKPAATVEIDGETYSMKIDLGGIGKGYAVDVVNAVIDEYGFKYGYFSFGTSSIVCKEHYINGDYKLGFYNPRSTLFSENYATTAIKNASLSTSGDYEQFFLYDSDGDGVKEWYCHVFDPTTGKPVQTGIMTATVIGGAAAEGDALTTAIMAMGKERAVQFINDMLSDRKVTFTYDNGGNYEIITNIPEDEITVINEEFKIVNTLSDGKIVLG